ILRRKSTPLRKQSKQLSRMHLATSISETVKLTLTSKVCQYFSTLCCALLFCIHIYNKSFHLNVDSNNAMKPMFHESNHFNNIQNYVNQVRNNIHQSIPRYQHIPEMHHPKSNQESYNQMMGGMNGEEMMNAAGNNQHEEGKSAGLSDTYMAD